MTETGIYDLPNEILEQCLINFSTHSLDTTLSNVCTRWKAQSEHILSRRVANIQRTVHPETLAELKTNFIGDHTDLKALKQFECLNMNPRIRFHVYLPAANYYKTSEEDIIQAYAWNLRSHLVFLSGELKDEESLLELDKLFKFIPCHELLVFLNDGELIFHHESVISTPSRTGYHPYEVESLGVADDNLSNGVRLLDVYHDRFAVVYKPQDKMVVYQIETVCHQKWKVTLRPLKTAFFCRPVLGITLFKETVYILYCNWILAAWPVSSDSSEARVRNSQRIIPREPVTNPLMDILMCRVNNILFIRLTNSDERRSWLPVPKWFILDMNDDSMDPVEVPIQDILLQLMPDRPFMLFGRRLCGISILGLQIVGNTLIFHTMWINILHRCLQDQGHSPTSDYEDIVLAYQLKRDPKMEDFLDLTKFNQLIDVPYDFASLDIIVGFITALPSSCFGTTKPTFIGLSNSKLESETGATVTTLTLCNVEGQSAPGSYIE